MSSPPQGRVAVNGPATLGDLRGRENSVASSFRPTVAGILGESSRYALRLQTVRPAWRGRPGGAGRASRAAGGPPGRGGGAPLDGAGGGGQGRAPPPAPCAVGRRGG